MVRRIGTLLLFIFSPIVIFFVYSRQLSHKAVITLDPALTYQTMMGWEAVAQAGQIDCPGFVDYKDELFDVAVNDLGINRLRVQIRASGSDSLKFNLPNFDHRVENVVLPMREMALARNEALFVNVIFIGESGFTTEQDMSAYAEQVLETYKHLENKYGFVPDAWEIAGEPGVVSPGWRASHLNDAIIRTNDILLENGYSDPYLIAPSSPCGPQKALDAFEDMLSSNNGIPPTGMDEFAYHRYCMATDQQLKEIAELRSTYGLNTSMLEHGSADYEELHADLKLANVSAWQQFALAYCTIDNGFQYYPVKDDTFSMGERTKFLRQYFKYVRIGAVRIHASSDSIDFDPLAFINPDGSYVAVVKADIGGELELAGLQEGIYGVKFTTDNQYDVDLSNITLKPGDSLRTAIPEKGVITIYALIGKTSNIESSTVPDFSAQTSDNLNSARICRNISIYNCQKK